MANADGIEGIAGNRKFMDHYYLYYKLKEELTGNHDNPQERDNAEYNSCQHYLLALTLCINKIHEMPNSDDYVDYIRWNVDIINDKLEQYKRVSNLEPLFPVIEVCKNGIKSVADKYFQLSECEKAISNQYIHAYERAIRPGTQNQNVYIHTARLYINYINLLKNRYYINNTDRESVTFSQLDSEADYLINKLNSIDRGIVSNIKLVNEAYEQFRYQDKTLRLGQDKAIKDALIIAHKRATETFLEGALRNIRETIDLILRRLRENINNALKASVVLLDPIIHPVKSGKNFVKFLRHPLESAKEIYKWSKERPWIFRSVAIGGIIIGICCGAGLAMGGAFLVDMAFTSIAIHSFSTWGLIGAIGGAIGGFGYPTAIAGGKLVQLKNESEKQIAEERKREAKIININDREGLKIAKQALYEEHMRETLKQSRELAEENIRRMRLEEERAEEERNRQINSMNAQQLNAYQLEIRNNNEELTANLNIVREELVQMRQQSRQIQMKMFRVREGRAAAESLMQDIADRSGPPIDPNEDILSEEANSSIETGAPFMQISKHSNE